MRKFIVTCSLLVALTIAVLVEYFCSTWPKSYFTMALTAIFFIYWGVEFVLDYVESKKSYPDRFTYYSAELVNKKDMPLSEIEANHKMYYKKFKRSIAQEILFHYFKFVTSFAIAIAIVIAMCI